MMYQFGHRMMGGRFIGMGMGILVCLAVIALIIIGIVALVRHLHRSGHVQNTHAPYAGTPTPGAPTPEAFNTAVQILNERYARGELTDEEYRAKKAEILK